MPRALCYIRCSHDDSAESGLGLEAQERSVRSYYEFLRTTPEHRNLEWGGVYTEPATSAWKESSRVLVQRKAGSKLNAELQRGDQVLLARLDRSFRWVPDAYETVEMWTRRGIGVHFVDLRCDVSTATGKMIFGVMAVMAQWWSDYVSERTREALQRRRENGGPVNQRTPPGKRIWRGGGYKKIIPDRESEAVGAYVVLLRNYYLLSWKQISDRVEEMFAKRENRKPVYWWDRKWKPTKCQRAYKFWMNGELDRPRASTLVERETGRRLVPIERELHHRQRSVQPVQPVQ